MELRLKWLVAFCLSFFLSLADASETVSFSKKKIVLEKVIIKVEMAETDKQHEQGLMFRKKLQSNEGMLFVFSDEQIRSFWMKNTIINLSIGYFDKNKKLIDVQEMKAVNSVLVENPPAYPSTLPAKYALEMTEGWFKKNKINLGSVFKFLKN